MSLSSTTNKVIYNGNGATSVWPFSFPVLEADHLAVVLTDGDGLETVLSATLYGVNGIGDPAGGSVTYPLLGSPIGVGTKLTLLRTVPYTQTTVLSNQGGYYPEVVERRFDQIYMALQQLEERMSRASLHLLSDPATEQSNLALIQQLQPMNILTEQGDLLTRDGSAFRRLARGSAGQFLGVAGSDLAWANPGHPVSPQGRLTLSSGEPVMTVNQTGKTSFFYTPYVGAYVPIHNGSAFVPMRFAERSNDLTQSSTGKAGPAAAGPYQVIDAFVWNDDGTIRLTRGPKWRKSGTFALSISTPTVVTWVGHGLHDGATWMPELTTGNLPTGGQVVVGTAYFVTKVDADTFKLSTTLANQIAGTFINASGTQSGVHTGANYTVDRGTGTGTGELERVDGIWTNKYDIANGPLARAGTFLGTVYCDGASQLNWHMGGLAAGGTEAKLHIWNAYNRMRVGGHVGSTTVQWGYYTNAWRCAGGSATIRISGVAGLAEEALFARYDTYAYDAAATSAVQIGVGVNTIQAPAGTSLAGSTASGVGFVSLGVGATARPVGMFSATALERTISSPSSGTLYYGAHGGTQTGLLYDWSY